MPEETGKFAALFRKYRLKAEFSTLSELGLALAEKGLIYEDSIFSHGTIALLHLKSVPVEMKPS